VSLFCQTSWVALTALVIYASQGDARGQTIINTVVGNGRILTGLGGPAVGVPLAGPRGLAFDSKGNLYIADNQQNVVFQVQPSGTVTIFAGSGVRGFSGDGGPAIKAAFMEPGAVAVDAANNVYIADFHNERIRKVDARGMITTVVGGGAAHETDEIPAIATTIFEPAGLALDASGSLYISEGGTCEVRKVTPDGIIHHVAGNGCGFSGDGGSAATAQLTFPAGLAFDSNGSLYIADSNNNRVRRIGINGIISTVAGNGIDGYSGDGGLATSASLALPGSVVIDAGGNLIIADTYNNRVRLVGPTGIITTLAGNSSIWPPGFSGDGGPAVSASFDLPYGVALDSVGNLYVSDQNNRRVRRIGVSGIVSTIAGNGISNFAGDGGPAGQASLDFPSAVKVDNLGNLYIADSMNHRVRKVSTMGIITTIAGNGTPGFSGDGGPATSAQLYGPTSVAIDGSGNVFISDSLNLRIRRVMPDGTITTYAGNGVWGYSGDGGPAVSASLTNPWGISTDLSGNLYVADNNNNVVRKITRTGVITTAAGNGNAGFSGDGGQATAAVLNGPADVASDQAGDLFIAEIYNGRVREVSPDGIITTVADSVASGLGDIEGVAANAGEVFLDGPCSVAVDDQGNFYFQAGWYIYRVNPAGVITLLVGAGLEGYQEGFDGDGGPSVAAHLVRDTHPGGNATMGMAVDAAGDLYFADVGNDRVRKITKANADAQLAITTPGSYTLDPPTGADDADFYLYGTSSQSVNILNVGVGAMSWTATASTLSGGDWLTVSSSSGTAPSTIAVSANVSGLAPGFYIGTVMFSSPTASNSPRYVTAYLTVPLPFLAQNNTSGAIVVTEPPGVGWSASSDASWITFPSGSTGIGSGILNWSAAANAGGSPPYRTATISIGYPQMNVNQGVGLVAQTITFAPLSDVLIGAAPFSISATASSGLPVSFASTTANVCTASGSTVTIVGSGACAITASQAGDANYAPATPVTLNFNVGMGAIGTPPLILSGGVVPVYSTINTIQPGSWISIYGSNLAISTAVWNGDFPVSLAGTSVSINGKPAYLSYVSPGLIDAQAPDDKATGPVSVVVTTPNGSSGATVSLAPVSPSFLRLDGTHVTGVILRGDGSGAYGGGSYDIIGPTGTSLGYSTVAARVGDNVELYGVGFGPTNPNEPAGQSFSVAAATTSHVYLTINNVSVTPSFAGLSGAGLYQINLTVPSDLGTGDVPLLATVDGVQTPTGVVISLQ
jgi:uncharacterized protein (TIGR03437 family)